jgi:sterol desaturase/sphingolipid hydroxylase (fatty acid hydroxylase superfamily)
MKRLFSLLRVLGVFNAAYFGLGFWLGNLKLGSWVIGTVFCFLFHDLWYAWWERPRDPKPRA